MYARDERPSVGCPFGRVGVRCLGKPGAGRALPTFLAPPPHPRRQAMNQRLIKLISLRILYKLTSLAAALTPPPAGNANTLKYSQGDDVCALEKELSLEARMKAAGINVEDIGDVAGEEPSGGGEGTATPARRQATNDGERGRLHRIQETGDAVLCILRVRVSSVPNALLLFFYSSSSLFGLKSSPLFVCRQRARHPLLECCTYHICTYQEWDERARTAEECPRKCCRGDRAAHSLPLSRSAHILPLSRSAHLLPLSRSGTFKKGTYM